MFNNHRLRYFVALLIIVVASLPILWTVQPVHADSFSASVNCPNGIKYSFTNDKSGASQYYIAVTDKAGNGLGSTAFTGPIYEGQGVKDDTFNLVIVPVPGDLKATLRRRKFNSDEGFTEVSSITLQNCWPPSLSQPAGSYIQPTEAPSTSFLSFTCTPTTVTIVLSDDKRQPLPNKITFTDKELLAAGKEGVTRALKDLGALSIAGSQGWDGYYYYAAWNGGKYNANGRGDFARTFKCLHRF
ncbi:MAG: hypothetical protein ABI947_13560 [Chloroflexota bacterium]